MQPINISGFLHNWSLIEQKIEQIAALPEAQTLGVVGRNFEGYKFDTIGDNQDLLITYRTSTWYSGCETDYFDFDILLSEINEPLQFFKDKFQALINKKKARQELQRSEQQRKTEKNELEQLRKLQQKYPNV